MKLFLVLPLILILSGCEMKKLYVERERAKTELIRQKSRVYEKMADRQCKCVLERIITLSLDDDANKVFRAITEAVDVPWFPIKKIR